MVQRRCTMAGMTLIHDLITTNTAGAHTSEQALALFRPVLELHDFVIDAPCCGTRLRPDGWRELDRTMIEVEAVRTVRGNQWATDIVKAIELQAAHLILLVKKANSTYKGMNDQRYVAGRIERLAPKLLLLGLQVDVLGW